jgi:hypothetical protein
MRDESRGAGLHTLSRAAVLTVAAAARHEAARVVAAAITYRHALARLAESRQRAETGEAEESDAIN